MGVIVFTSNTTTAISITKPQPRYTQKSVNRTIPALALLNRLVHAVSTRPKIAQPSPASRRSVWPPGQGVPKTAAKSRAHRILEPRRQLTRLRESQIPSLSALASRGNSVHSSPVSRRHGGSWTPGEPPCLGQRKGRRGDWWIIAMSCLSLKLRRAGEAMRDCEEISGEDAQSVETCQAGETETKMHWIDSLD